ncbi:hypothetical protein OBBRIDRAFT_763355 [Obba rivulosa]|uniref:Velvet domain-containing protein n=1 Tax=Obba rivulosa TaxID=1052685 RepID=A0A8E2DFN6_9APHY|nr:hypothetical protein OBBRIDRAFT_763355 [Obba rivulosa]
MALTSRIRRMGSPEIDSPATFISGEFAGRTIRGELVEVQKADLGRKYARKDRRPLDPPPVVQLKLFEVFGHGLSSSYEREFDSYDEVMSFGFLCHVDLFPVRDVDLAGYPAQEQERHRRASVSGPTPHPYSPQSPDISSASSASQPVSAQHQARAAMPSFYTLPPPRPPSFYASQSVGTPSSTPSSSSSGYTSTPAHQITSPTVSTSSTHQSGTPSSSTTHPPIALPMFAGVPPSLSSLIPGMPGMGLHSMVSIHGTSSHVSDSPSDIVAFYDELPITENSKCTSMLAGTTFQDSSVVDLHGKLSIVFVFSDMAVRQEGRFIVRFRVFNVFGQATGSCPVPVLGECFGGPFKIYSTKDFPGLRASTDLTKKISLHGIRTNIRARERKRRKINDSECVDPSPRFPASPAAPSQALTNGKVRRKRCRDEDEEYEENSLTED